MTSEETLPTRWSLVARLKDWDDQESWRDFFDSYWRLIYGVAIRAGLDDAAAQEVVQDTVLTVARKITGFQADPGRGSFKSWLLQIVRWRIADQVRRRQREASRLTESMDDTGQTPVLERVPDPVGGGLDPVWEEEWERNLLDLALSRLRRSTNPLHYQIFDLHVLKDWPVRQVARSLGVSVGQVYLVKHRLAKNLHREIDQLKRQTR